MKFKAKANIDGAMYDFEFEGNANEIDRLEDTTDKIKASIRKLADSKE